MVCKAINFERRIMTREHLEILTEAAEICGRSGLRIGQAIAAARAEIARGERKEATHEVPVRVEVNTNQKEKNGN
jgi:hypothetical protein